MSIIYLLCVILIGLWLWSLIRNFNHHKYFHFILQLLLGVFVVIPILTFIMRRSNRMRVGIQQRGYIPVASTRSKGAADIYRQAQGDRRGFYH
jgi:cytochrome bd-type quinol oxidase subunit 2